ncbi:probable nuclear transport factor 2 [Paramacrobiotus metropolitanus]|uniref:probable nuclear transport factor 2 n=1 Tax=Paramacrobiotus metropolitanus TaxID=2943436 RepID=UPI0024460DE0|nr:probable nuclear transport factor 2 [Paramacrobiotus metropolitanus]XP_055343697.1 probable nuclear transport factor 2 [Paramacrobiotus metropolitanus]
MADHLTQFEQIGQAFVKHYYTLFDNQQSRTESLINMYYQQGCFQTFEGNQAAGHDAIRQKLAALTFQRIARSITSVDCQPLPDGIMVVVLGQLKTDEDQPQSYVESFVLKASGGNYFITNNVFRLVLHHM